MALRVPSAAIKNTPALDKKRILKNMSAVSGAMVLGGCVDSDMCVSSIMISEYLVCFC